MSLNDILLADMKDAMKEREAGKIRLSTIRMVRAAQKEAEIDMKRELTDGELIDIISRELKKRKESLVEFIKANRPDSVRQLEEEIQILKAYLPEQMNEDEIRAIIRDAIQETGAQGSNDMGKVMQAVMPGLKGRADGKIINQYVREMLH